MIDFNVIWHETKKFLTKIVRWNRGWVYGLQVKRDIDDYVMFWIFFGFGVASTLFFQWVF